MYEHLDCSLVAQLSQLHRGIQPFFFFYDRRPLNTTCCAEVFELVPSSRGTTQSHHSVTGSIKNFVACRLDMWVMFWLVGSHLSGKLVAV